DCGSEVSDLDSPRQRSNSTNLIGRIAVALVAFRAFRTGARESRVSGLVIRSWHWGAGRGQSGYHRTGHSYSNNLARYRRPRTADTQLRLWYSERTPTRCRRAHPASWSFQESCARSWQERETAARS